MTQLTIRLNYDRHIRLTRRIAFNEYYHAVLEKDYASATEWSLLWYRCTAALDSFNVCEDSAINNRLLNCS